MLGVYALLRMIFLMLAIHVILPIGLLELAKGSAWGLNWNFKLLDTVMLDIASIDVYPKGTSHAGAIQSTKIMFGYYLTAFAFTVGGRYGFRASVWQNKFLLTMACLVCLPFLACVVPFVNVSDLLPTNPANEKNTVRVLQNTPLSCLLSLNCDNYHSWRYTSFMDFFTGGPEGRDIHSMTVFFEQARYYGATAPKDAPSDAVEH